MVDSEIEDVMYNAGMNLRNNIVDNINSNIPPPNAPSTIRHKKSSHTLVDTGHMMDSVDVRRMSSDGSAADIAVGIFDEGVARYAIANEFGSSRMVTTYSENEMHQGYSMIIIPERNFMRTAYDKNIDEILDKAGKEIGEIMSRRFMEGK